MRVSDLWTYGGLDTSTVSRHVQQLQQAGLVPRSNHPDDGRAQQVDLNDEGRRVLDDSVARRRALPSQRLQHWAPDDIDLLDRLLARLVTNLRNLTTDQEPD